MILRKLAISMIATGALVFGSGIQAATYLFGSLLSGGGPASVHLADLDINDLGSGHWSFSLYNIDLSVFGSGAFILNSSVEDS